MKSQTDNLFDVVAYERRRRQRRPPPSLLDDDASRLNAARSMIATAGSDNKTCCERLRHCRLQQATNKKESLMIKFIITQLMCVFVCLFFHYWKLNASRFDECSMSAQWLSTTLLFKSSSINWMPFNSGSLCIMSFVFFVASLRFRARRKGWAPLERANWHPLRALNHCYSQTIINDVA